MTLYIDTTDFNSVMFAISEGKKIKKQTYKLDPHKSHETLQKLGEFLKAIHYPLSTIHSIQVNKGPGSYTGTRVGITIAQALGFAWNVPVSFLGKDKFALK